MLSRRLTNKAVSGLQWVRRVAVNPAFIGILLLQCWFAPQCSALVQPLKPSTDDLVVETSLDVDDKLPLVTANLDGHELVFFLDTGSASSILYRGDKSWLRGESIKVPSSSGGVSFSRDSYRDQCLRINGERFYGAVSLLDEDNSLSGFIPMCDGFLGMDLFRDYAIEINPDEKVFRVYDQVPDGIEQTADFVLRMRNDRFVELDFNKSGRTLAVLDTGSEFGITLEQNIFDKLVAEKRIGSCVVSPAATLAGYRVRLAGQLSGEPLCALLTDSVVVHQAVTPNPQQSSTNLGWPFLRRFVTVIDFTRNRVLLRKSQYFDEHEVIDRSGIRFSKTEEGILVSGCYENSPAHKAGIEASTFLTGIDGTQTSEMSVFEIMHRLSILGESVKLTLRQNSMDRDLTITLQDFQDIVVPRPDGEAKLLADIHVSTESAVPIVAIEVNEQMMSAILDTTVRPLVLNTTTATSVGISSDSQSDVAERIKSIRVGGQPWKVETAAMLDLSPRSKAFDQKIQAVIGPHLFGENVVHLDLGNQRVQIFDRVSNLVKTEFECFRLEIDQNGMKLAVAIPGYGAEDFYLASSVYLPLTLKGEVFDTLVKRKIMTISGSEKANSSSDDISDFPVGKLHTVNIGTSAWKNIDVVRFQHSCIGFELLRKMVVVIDRKNQCCYIKQAPQEDAVDLSGLTLMRGDSGVTVLRCKQDSIAEGAGIKPRDRLLRINGSEVETLPLAQMRQMLSKPASTVSLLVQRDESESFTVDLNL